MAHCKKGMAQWAPMEGCIPRRTPKRMICQVVEAHTWVKGCHSTAGNEVHRCFAAMQVRGGLAGSSAVEYKGFPRGDGSMQVGIGGEHWPRGRVDAVVVVGVGEVEGRVGLGWVDIVEVAGPPEELGFAVGAEVAEAFGSVGLVLLGSGQEAGSRNLVGAQEGFGMEGIEWLLEEVGCSVEEVEER